jgi:type I protein arginine methyltransferase
VMDIGAGSGILSFFAAQAGASHVYAVEASSMGEVIGVLAASNTSKFPGSTIQVINRPLETITTEVDDKVDVLVSEPIGTFLFNERMIESYLVARDRFLKPGGKMFPNVGTICIAPFSDAMLHWEQSNKNGFWKTTDFYGLDLTAAVARCTREHFRQPIVDYINPECLVSKCLETRFDFTTITVESLHTIEIPFDFEIHQPCLVHGMAGWFDAYFEGSNSTVLLSTAPWCPGTHWYQIRFLLETPLAVNAGQRIEGTLKMEANNVQSYYVRVHMRIKGTDIFSDALCIDLKDPEYRFYSSPNAYCPPGTVSPHQASAAAQPASPQQQQQAHFMSTQNVPLQANGYSVGR